MGNKEDTPSLRLSSGLYAYDSARPVALLLPLTRPMESPFDGTAARGAGPTDTHERASSRERQPGPGGRANARRRARDSGRCALAESTTTRVRFEPLPRSCFVAVSSVADGVPRWRTCMSGDALLYGGSATVRPYVLLEVVKRARVASVRTPRCRQKRAAGWPARRAPRVREQCKDPQGYNIDRCQKSACRGDILRRQPAPKDVVPMTYDGTAQPISVQV